MEAKMRKENSRMSAIVFQFYYYKPSLPFLVIRKHFSYLLSLQFTLSSLRRDDDTWVKKLFIFEKKQYLSRVENNNNKRI